MAERINLNSIGLIILIVLTPFICFIDIKYYRIPDVFSLGGWLACLVLTFVFARNLLISSVVGSSLSFLLMYTVARLKPGRLGMGDVKLSLLTGSVSGWAYWNFSLLAATLLALIFYCLVHRKSKEMPRFPFGPFLCAGCLSIPLIRRFLPL